MEDPRVIKVAARLEIGLDEDRAVRIRLRRDGRDALEARLRDGSSLERFFYALGKDVETERTERRHIPWFG
jgi:hypothetical protein